MMLPFSYQVKRINIGGVVGLFSWIAIPLKCKNSARFFQPTDLNFHGATLSPMGVYPQPEVLQSNGVYRRIQRIKQVRNTIERSSDCSGGALCENLRSTDGSEYVATVSLSSHLMGRIKPGHLSEKQD